MDDLLGLGFGDSGGVASPVATSNDDVMNGFAGLDLGGSNKPPPPTQQLGGQAKPKSNQDLLDLF